MNNTVTNEELDYFFGKINFSASALDAKAIEIMNRLESSLRPTSTQGLKDLMALEGFPQVPSTGLYWNDPDEGKSSGWVKGFLGEADIGIYSEDDCQIEVDSWELEFKTIQNEPNPLDEMMRFQTNRQLDKMPYDNLNETTLVLEEIFESFVFDVPKENREALSNSFKRWMTTCTTNKVITYDTSKVDDNGDVLWEESVDSTCDQIVFLVGKLMKLGVDPKLALLETSKEINSRKGRLIDGKFTKYREDEEGYEPTYKADYTKFKV